MSILDAITQYQPTPKDLQHTPRTVRKYIKELEAVLIKHILQDKD